MQKITRPSDETIQQIDFVIQGLENGKYKEIPTEVEFHEKLKGADAPDFLYSLIHALEAAQLDILNLQNRTDQQGIDITDLQQRLDTLEIRERTSQADTVVMAKGIQYAIEPKPLDKSYDLQEVNNWLSTKGIY